MKNEDDLNDDMGDYAPDLEMDAVDDDSPWMPPIDPPILPRGTDRAVVPGAIDDLEESDEQDELLSDDQIAARVRRLLRSDSATSMLRIHVTVSDRVVTLRGLVQTLEDTDNAAEVASRAPSVVDVVDDLEVED
jgi:hypothetical protein